MVLSSFPTELVFFCASDISDAQEDGVRHLSQDSLARPYVSFHSQDNGSPVRESLCNTAHLFPTDRMSVAHKFPSPSCEIP